MSGGLFWEETGRILAAPYAKRGRGVEDRTTERAGLGGDLSELELFRDSSEGQVRRFVRQLQVGENALNGMGLEDGGDDL